MKMTLALAAVLIFATSAASAAGPVVSWTTKDMKMAIRALGYPKAHPKKLACKGSGAEVGNLSFRCVGVYRHHLRRVFYTQGQGEGGWICAGKTLAGCKVLRRGFVTSQQVGLLGSHAAVAGQAARGYLQDRGQTYIVTHFCTASGSSWSCPFVVDGAQVVVMVGLASARGGYVVSAVEQS